LNLVAFWPHISRVLTKVNLMMRVQNRIHVQRLYCKVFSYADSAQSMTSNEEIVTNGTTLTGLHR